MATDMPRLRVADLREVADAAGVGPATATRTVRELERYDVVDARRSGRESEIRLKTDPIVTQQT